MLPRFKNIAFRSSIYIPDVSEWEDITDIYAVKRAGYQALMMRAAVMIPGYGIREDYKFAQGRLPYVTRAGIVPIFYAYLVPGVTGARAAAQFCYKTVEHRGGFRRYGALPFVHDIEQSLLGAAGTVEWASEFDDEMHRLTGRGCIAYDPNWFWGDRGAPRQGTLYWASDYRTPFAWAYPHIPRGFKHSPYFWQYTDQATVPGITGNVDISLFRGSRKQFQGLRLG